MQKHPKVRVFFIGENKMNKVVILRTQVESKKIAGKMFDMFVIRKEWIAKATNEVKFRELQLNKDELKALSEEVKKMEEDLAWQPFIKK
jgi:hypothetical protein